MPKVIVLGGGVAGMSAAHELIERGFEVEVYDRHKQYAGGKARSVHIKVPGEEKDQPLPGEHGFRFFSGVLQTCNGYHEPDSVYQTGRKQGNGI